VIRLERDYRSTPQVVSLANQVIGAARGRPAGSRLKLVGQRPPGPEPRFAEYEDEAAEAAAAARRVRELLDGGATASEIAVLFRINAQSEAYEQALTEAGIPYLVRGGERFFARAEVRQAMSALRVASGDPTGPDLVTAVRSALAKVGLTEQPPAGGAAKERWDALLAIVELAEELSASVAEADLPRFVAELDQRAAAQHPPTVEGVTLASLHAAKGLEWDAVFLVGLSEGTMPILHADGDEAAIEEERRLFYVGVTRARVHLSLSWSLSRTPGGRRNRRRSRFLYGLIPEDHPAARIARSQGKPAAGVTARCRLCGGPLLETMEVKLGRCSRCPSTVDEGLLEKLKAWRGERSRELKVPAFVVFTDATLMAIAEQRPTDDGALVSISGIGATKLERFGAEVLNVVRTAMRS
jgi:ATP-dependent DNA helicase UvrD/PcrA